MGKTKTSKVISDLNETDLCNMPDSENTNGSKRRTNESVPMNCEYSCYVCEV